MKESEIQKSIIYYLTYKKYFFWRNNSGALKTERGGFYRFGAVGSPDIFLIKKGLLWGIEVKKKGGKLSEGQIIFKDNMIKNGARYLVAYSLDDVIAVGL
jgi:hypothetical protein